MKNNFKSIYVMLSANGNVKIGISQDPQKRVLTVASTSGYGILNYYFTPKCRNASDIEYKIHKHLESYKLKGEWFSIEYDYAVDIVNNFYENFAKTETLEADFSKSVPTKNCNNNIFKYPSELKIISAQLDALYEKLVKQHLIIEQMEAKVAYVDYLLKEDLVPQSDIDIWKLL